ncbi:hypothetical protein [Bradyrhizobium zhanjiangense]|uniref:Uncharacterized protein n=1 Tax=Bradyrhizobium zhanjiangense TaxID=1325107 RepID=A0A4Q0QM79_9BRAD|nr:hypothetical protein [Bradyrhizobium zhanjiangense]RXG90767.1 hypothetical protein EAS62_27495 [Bradyrhizobium zhanjiangense]RXG95214.1 hypothetical protein EAS61_18795 [Bradyrhizobium zhanjiangense]
MRDDNTEELDWIVRSFRWAAADEGTSARRNFRAVGILRANSWLREGVLQAGRAIDRFVEHLGV